MDYAELGRKIRLLRRQQNLTQQQLAEKVGLSTSFIGHIERGSRVLSLDTFVQLCTVLHASPAYLLTLPEQDLPLSPDEAALMERLLQYACHLVQAQ